MTDRTAAQSKPTSPWILRIPGIALSLLVAVAAFYLGKAAPLVGGPVFGILLGLVLGSIRRPSSRFVPGIQFSSKQLLQLAIVIMGFTLPLHQVWATGSESLVVMLSTLAVCLVGAFLIGKALGVSDSLTMLVGSGTGICGASAIAAVSSVIDAEQEDVAYSISTVFFFNVVAVVIFPALGHLLGFSQKAFGLWAGTAINDTSSVVAAAYSYGKAAGDYATVVKLSRATMIIPISLGFAAWRSLRSGAQSKVNWMKLIPWFIVWFLAASVARSLVPALALPWVPDLAKFLIIVALSAVGLGSDIRAIAKTGWRPLALGAMLWVLVACTSIVVQRITGT